ncbi:MAG: hypothetical protein ACJ71Q_22095 [Terriglobales bacterium]|jgi:hypothetical protein
MRLFRTFALGVALLTSSAWAFGQGYGYHDPRYQDRDDRQAYRQGYEQGREDARRHRRFHADTDRYRERDDRRAYSQGYQAGYNSGGRDDHDWDRDRDRDRDRNNAGYNGSYGNRGYGNFGQVAQQNGYRDGMNDGRKDRATGHSFRPTQGDNFRNAPGYSSSMGDRQQYKNTYREGYQQGYQLGYNGRR